MGYYIELSESDFQIKSANVKKVNEVFKKYSGDPDDMHEPDWQLEILNVEDILADSTVEPEIELTFNGEKLRHEPDMFDEVAPFVEKGSWIEIKGEDSIWRYYFDGVGCYEIQPEITWKVPDSCK